MIPGKVLFQARLMKIANTQASSDRRALRVERKIDEIERYRCNVERR